MADRSVVFDIIARDRASAVLEKTSGKMDKLRGAMLGFAAGAGAAVGVIATQAIAGARESAQIHRVLESQIKGMGAASKAAFGGATKFAEEYGQAIGKDDDDILKVINKLSTFPAAFGKGTMGAEAMRRATQAAFDLEAAGVGSAESNIIGLGKALDNPIKGLTALSKSGVSFTEEQKKQITNYTKSGQLAKAQAVLLQGIESNAKGAAAQQADGLTRAKVALDGFAESLATKALPYLDKFGNWSVATGLPAIEKYGGKFVEILGNPAVQKFALGIAAIVVAIKAYQGVMAVITFMTKAWAAAQTVLNFILTANPIGLIIVAVALLAAGLVLAYKKSETFRNVLPTGFRAVQTVVRLVVNAVLTYYGLLLTAAAKAFGWIPGIGPKLKAAAAEFKTFRDKVNVALGGIRDKTVNVSVLVNGKRTTTAISAMAANVRENRSQTARAGGGPVTPGMAYRVGEFGEETFVPNMAGRIVPNARGGNVVIEAHFHSVVPGSEADYVRKIESLRRRYGAGRGVLPVGA